MQNIRYLRMKVKPLNYREIAKDIRRRIVYMHFQSGSSHIGSALSSVEILVSLYFNILRLNVQNENYRMRDRFILSKGHACSALYAVLAKKGFCPEKYLAEYCIDGGRLPGHVTKNCIPGIEVSTGSLGHGLSIGAGIAVAGKFDKLNYRGVVLLSDGECNEGSIWEAALFAGHHKLDNLVAIIDYNKIQALGRTKEILDLEPFRDKWSAFGWQVREVDGHDCDKIIQVFKKIPFKKDRPSLLIAHTIKGKGISFMEDQVKWHYKSPSKEELKIALAELG